jgi:hypothetical protein
VNNSNTGPGTYNTEMKASNTRTKATIDRYAMLQRKVEDLERIHADSKKSVRSYLHLTVHVLIIE